MWVFYIVLTPLKIRICSLIAGFWSPKIPSKCLNQHAIFVTNTVMSWVADLTILVLPVPLLWSLQMPIWKKIRIAALLGAGGVAVASSVIRLALIAGPLSADKTVARMTFKVLRYVSK
jgi:hypothetical protein